MDKPTAGLRKRQQISRANRIMFLWIIGVSVVVGVSAVLIVFLVQRIVFDEKVINEKYKTATVLQKNIDTVEALKEEVRVLDTNEALATVSLDETKPPIQSVLDALPADANSTALAASFQLKLLTGVPNVVIETLSVTPTSAGESTAGSTGVDEISFNFSVSTGKDNFAALREVLERLEKSIRPIRTVNIAIESQGNKVVMSVKGVSYYEPARQVELKQKVVKQ
jgi:hypothetical protein